MGVPNPNPQSIEQQGPSSAWELHPWRGWAAPGGWVRIKSTSSQRQEASIYMQLEADEEGILRVRFAGMSRPDAVRAEMWSGVPFEAIEMAANDEGMFHDELIKTDDAGAVIIEELERRFPADAPSVQFVLPTKRDPRKDLVALQAPVDGLSDEFFRALAQAYRTLTAARIPPAPAIAEQTGVSPRTVHRWIYQARQRNFLPAGAKGRAG